jgi:hypothetical protein
MKYLKKCFRYGHPRIAYRIAGLTLDAMLHLNKNEFTAAERRREFGTLVV